MMRVKIGKKESVCDEDIYRNNISAVNFSKESKIKYLSKNSYEAELD